MNKKIKLKRFTYYEGKDKKIIQVKICKSFWSKFSGLMFKKSSLPLLFIFDREKTLSIHSFFCKPFIALWLDKEKKVTKKLEIKKWRPNFSGKGKYLLEMPIK